MGDVWAALQVDADGLVSRRESAMILKRLLPSLRGDDSGDSGDSLVRCIAIRIGRAIVEGRLAPGADLNSVEVARFFQTSRTPVREALLLLEKEGLVEVAPHKRPRVATVTLEDARYIYEVRAALAALVAERIVRTASDEEIDRLWAVYPRLEAAVRAGDVHAYHWELSVFRDLETTIAGNKEAKRILDSLGLRVLQLRHLSLSLPGRLEHALDHRRRVLQAYRDRDAVLASALNRSAAMNSFAVIERHGWPPGSPANHQAGHEPTHPTPDRPSTSGDLALVTGDGHDERIGADGVHRR
jgi:DNA-binding GntR family transcriptional regulator